MFSNIIFKIQNKFNFLYKNSLFLQNIDFFILLSIITVLVMSLILNSDYIGFIAFITLFLTVVKILTKPQEKFSFNIFEIFLVTYFMLVVISLAGSSLFILSLKGFFKTFLYIGFYFSCAHYLKHNTNKIPWIIITIAFCMSFESIAALLQNFSHVEAISTWQDTSGLNPEEVMTRVYGTLKPFNPNLLGGYFVSGIPALFAACIYFLINKHHKLALTAAIFSILSVIALFATGCRGSYLALILIFACIFLVSAKFFWHKYKKIYLSLAGCAIGLFTSALIFVTSLRARFLSIFAMRQDSSNSFRFNVYQSSLQMLKDNWILGIGVGNRNFREIYGLYMKTGFDALSAYNIFLEIAVESGIFALIAFLGFLITLIKDAVKIILKSTEHEKIIFVSAALISILAVMFHGLVDTVFFRPQIQFVFWCMTAVISAEVFTSKTDF